MSKVISTWYFEPMPESMRIVLPVQVLRTDKPLPLHATLEARPVAGHPARQPIGAAPQLWEVGY